MKQAYLVCLTCSRSLHATVNFNAGSLICDDCIKLDKRTLVDMAITVVRRDHAAMQSAVAQRKAAKVTEYLVTGKRCVHGHHYKPPIEFDKCASRSDGLQPACRACNKLRVSLLTSYGASGQGKKMWHLARDAMRTAAAQEQANPTPKAQPRYRIGPDNGIAELPPLTAGAESDSE